MSLNADIQLVNSEYADAVLGGGDRENLCFEFDLYGGNLRFDVSVGTGMVGFGDIVPLARAACDKITEAVIRKNITQGERIPCCEGCCNCCNYLVTVSPAEVFCLVDDIKNLDGSFYKYVQRSALLACKRILKKKPPVFSNHSELDALSDWYKSLDLSCPFLFEGRCSIYNARPLVCREFFIKGSPNACKSKRGAAEVLEMPVSVAGVLNGLCAELESENDTSVMLAFFQAWANDNEARKTQRFPAEYLVRKFIELFERAAAKTKEEVSIGG